MAKSMCNVISFVVALLLLSQRPHAQEDDGGMDEDMDDDEEMAERMGEGSEEEEQEPSTTQELQELKSVSDFETLINTPEPSVIGAFTAKEILDPKATRPSDWDDEEDGEWEPPTIDNPAFKSFVSIASSLHGHRFAYTTASAVLEKLKTKAGGVYLYRSPFYVSKEHGERIRERFTSDTLTEGGISHWLETKSQLLVGEYNIYTQAYYKSAVLIVFMNLDFTHNAKSVNYVLKRARKVAVGVRGKLRIAVASTHSMGSELSDYGLTSDKDADILMAIRGGLDNLQSTAPKYSAPRDKAFSEAALSAFANAYLAGELTPQKNEEDADGMKDAKDEL